MCQVSVGGVLRRWQAAPLTGSSSVINNFFIYSGPSLQYSPAKEKYHHWGNLKHLDQHQLEVVTQMLFEESNVFAKGEGD